MQAEAEARAERPEQEERAGEAAEEDRRARPRRPGARLREPEPDVQRGEEQDERERVRGHDEERHDAEREQRGGVARHLLARADPPPREQPVAGHEPGRSARDEEAEDRHDRPVGRDGARWRRRDSGAARPRAREREELEEAADEEPEAEAAQVAPQRGRERDPAPPATGEEVDGGGEERKERRDQHELDRPAAHDARAKVDVRRGALRQVEPLVERAEELLRRAAELGETDPVEVLRRVAEGGRRPVARARERDRRDAAVDERRLLVEAEREREVDELAERARPARTRTGLLEDAQRRGLDERRGGRAGRVAGHLEARTARAGERVEVHDRDHVLPPRRLGGEVLGAEAAERAAVGREEEDPVRRRRSAPAADVCVAAGELDERRRSGSVVVGAWTRSGIVAVGHDDDRLGRAARRHRREVLEPDAASAGDRGLEPVDLRPEVVGLELLLEPLDGPGRSRRPGRAVREGAGEVGRERGRGVAVEGRWQRRRGQRRRASDAECGDEEREADEQPRPAVHPGADGSFQ